MSQNRKNPHQPKLIARDPQQNPDPGDTFRLIIRKKSMKMSLKMQLISRLER